MHSWTRRSFAHVCETGGMRRVHLRGHPNILKRLLVHVAGCKLWLLLRHVIGVGTPRSLQAPRMKTDPTPPAVPPNAATAVRATEADGPHNPGVTPCQSRPA